MANKQLRTVAADEPQMLDTRAPSIPPQVFQHTVSQADMAISITDVRGNILYVNPAFTRVTGFASDEAIGRNQSILSNKTMPPALYQSLWETISRGEAWSGRLINRRKDGSKYLAELNISPIVGADGEVLNYLGMHRDVTEVHRLEYQVRNQKALIESVSRPYLIVRTQVSIGASVGKTRSHPSGRTESAGPSEQSAARRRIRVCDRPRTRMSANAAAA